MTPTTTRGSEKIVHRPAIYSGVWTDDLDSVLHWTWLEHWEAERERRKNKSKPSASELRQAIALGTKLAEEEALFKLAMKPSSLPNTTDGGLAWSMTGTVAPSNSGPRLRADAPRQVGLLR